MKRFKNKAEMQQHLLHPREIERKTGKDGKTYRIYDDGNYLTTHLFTIEVLVATCSGTAHWGRVSDVFVDWKDVSSKFSAL